MKTIPIALAAMLTLAACQTTGTPEPSTEPGPEIAAFDEVDAKLGYPDTEMGADGDGCATYTATGPGGAPHSERLRGPMGEDFCAPGGSRGSTPSPSP
ncbi:hypothetical protein [Palleronia sp. LCG004]|uniref:hypothetical protein n=1 Tax=Palleronia sp. LCG004 TaxID=3079304 RepID=UPI002942043B|nr:hypothetical protein [Palleronia sp. LCG004]WOI56280.1 hypothetical protein RVY76_00355 [Palleronia sp. LCG004]